MDIVSTGSHGKVVGTPAVIRALKEGKVGKCSLAASELESGSAMQGRKFLFFFASFSCHLRYYENMN